MAVTFWEILHRGKMPFLEQWQSGLSIPRIFDNIEAKKLTLTLPNNAPKHVKGLVKTCLAIDPDARPSAAKVLEILESRIAIHVQDSPPTGPGLVLYPPRF